MLTPPAVFRCFSDQISHRISKFYAEFWNNWIVQNIKLRLSAKQQLDNMYFLYSFTAGEWSVISAV